MWPETVDVEKTKSTIFEQIQAYGGDYAEATYSGGNDEGGVDDVRVYRHVDGEKLALDVPAEQHYDAPLHQAFDDLLSIEFGTWAGEFEASGCVSADVRERRVWRSGEVMTYETDETGGEY